MQHVNADIRNGKTCMPYRIISYDPNEMGLLTTAYNAVEQFIMLVRRLGVATDIVPSTIDTYECAGNDQISDKCEAIGKYDNNGEFSVRLHVLKNKIKKETNFCGPNNQCKDKVLFVTTLDIGMVIGVSFGWLSAISTNKLMHNETSLAWAVFHELGHMHDIPSLERTNIGNLYSDQQIIKAEQEMQGKNTIYNFMEEHCLNSGCSMRQRISFEQLRKLASEPLQPGKMYCDKCVQDLKGYFNMKGGL